MSAAIDWDSCQNICLEEKGLAYDIVASFVEALPGTLKAIRMAYLRRENDTLNLQLTRLLSSCCYCSVPKLSDLVKRLELVLDYDYNHNYILSLIESIELEAKRVTAAFKQASNPHFID